ncbi:DUF4845 domain-containing protein [Roseateles terrae]|uniref:DUF4845 domain-containing protein n=1 Tax=Roseateles terrae TaxID=431060 RepID=A0ABR6GSP8_9BURK|nr:DUF4845 domain-containing protein [Roseateles terrae]MBB3195139.1 hypothetical protein [Roseateles terrae]OWQ87161.1 hypothetical protein CDN98_09940 [Roseateles terrae]
MTGASNITSTATSATVASRAGTAARRQRGISLFGLLFWGVILAFLAVVGMRVAPTVMEYFTILKTVEKIASSGPGSVADARASFARTQEIEYSIVSITPNDLVITKKEDKVKISFAYDKEVSLGGPVYLLIKYKGETR